MKQFSIKVLPWTRICKYRESLEVMLNIIKSMAERVSRVWFAKLRSRELRWVAGAHTFVPSARNSRMKKRLKINGVIIFCAFLLTVVFPDVFLRDDRMIGFVFSRIAR